MTTIDPNTIADPTAAVAGYLLATVGQIVEGRVFCPDLPRTESEGGHMPRACIVVSAAPGGYTLFGDSYLPVGDPRIAIRSYGSTRLESDNVGRACLVAMKELRPSVWEGVRLQWANIASGIVPMIEIDTKWPYSMLMVQVMCDEIVGR